MRLFAPSLERSHALPSRKVLLKIDRLKKCPPQVLCQRSSACSAPSASPQVRGEVVARHCLTVSSRSQMSDPLFPPEWPQSWPCQSCQSTLRDLRDWGAVFECSFGQCLNEVSKAYSEQTLQNKHPVLKSLMPFCSVPCASPQ